MIIKNYYDFAKEYTLLQGDKPEGVGLARTLNRKRVVLRKHGIPLKTYLWAVPFNILDEIIKRSKK